MLTKLKPVFRGYSKIAFVLLLTPYNFVPALLNAMPLKFVIEEEWSYSAKNTTLPTSNADDIV